MKKTKVLLMTLVIAMLLFGCAESMPTSGRQNLDGPTVHTTSPQNTTGVLPTTQPTTLPTQPTIARPATMPTEPVVIPSEPPRWDIDKLFSYQSTGNYSVGIGQDWPDDQDYRLTVIRSVEDAETCPYYKYQTKDYGEDFYQENTLIFLRCAAAGSPVKYSLLNVVKNEDGSYCIQVECARYAAVQDLPCSTLIVIVVNEAIPENARLDVDIATRIVCWPEVLDESEFDW